MTLETVSQPIPWIRITLCILALAGPFFFPWYVAAVIAVVAALSFPPIALVAGVLLDSLYWGGMGFPIYTISGIFVTVIAHFVHQFLKTRIMS